MTRTERRSHWRSIIENHWTSGMTIAVYCREIRIKSSYFYTWRPELWNEEASSGSFLELCFVSLPEDNSGFRILLAG